MKAAILAFAIDNEVSTGNDLGSVASFIDPTDTVKVWASGKGINIVSADGLKRVRATLSKAVRREIGNKLLHINQLGNFHFFKVNLPETDTAGNAVLNTDGTPKMSDKLIIGLPSGYGGTGHTGASILAAATANPIVERPADINALDLAAAWATSSPVSRVM